MDSHKPNYFFVLVDYVYDEFQFYILSYSVCTLNSTRVRKKEETYVQCQYSKYCR